MVFRGAHTQLNDVLVVIIKPRTNYIIFRVSELLLRTWVNTTECTILIRVPWGQGLTRGYNSYKVHVPTWFFFVGSPVHYGCIHYPVSLRREKVDYGILIRIYCGNVHVTYPLPEIS